MKTFTVDGEVAIHAESISPTEGVVEIIHPEVEETSPEETSPEETSPEEISPEEASPEDEEIPLLNNSVEKKQKKGK